MTNWEEGTAFSRENYQCVARLFGSERNLRLNLARIGTPANTIRTMIFLIFFNHQLLNRMQLWFT